MADIHFRISDKDEMKIRQKAKEKNKNISAYCREKILGEIEEEIDKITLEARIENMEEVMAEMIKAIQINSAVTKAFIVFASDEKRAEELIQNVLKTYNKEGD